MEAVNIIGRKYRRLYGEITRRHEEHRAKRHDDIPAAAVERGKPQKIHTLCRKHSTAGSIVRSFWKVSPRSFFVLKQIPRHEEGGMHADGGHVLKEHQAYIR